MFPPSHSLSKKQPSPLGGVPPQLPAPRLNVQLSVRKRLAPSTRSVPLEPSHTLSGSPQQALSFVHSPRWSGAAQPPKKLPHCLSSDVLQPPSPEVQLSTMNSTNTGKSVFGTMAPAAFMPMAWYAFSSQPSTLIEPLTPPEHSKDQSPL